MNRNHLPSPGFFRNESYVTYRRLWLDSLLSSLAREMRGIVVDLGGKRENKRGAFAPPEGQARSWWYVNLDMGTKPNIYADVTRVPLTGRRVDCIVCTEVLEHLPDPQACVDEIHRLLCDGGWSLLRRPFSTPSMRIPMTSSASPKTVCAICSRTSNPLRFIAWVDIRACSD